MRKKSKKIPLYTGDLVILQLDKDESMNDIGKFYNLNWDLSNYNGVAFKDKNKYIIAFHKKTTPSMIAHESLHAVSYIFSDHVIKMDCDNDEPIAYLLEWVVYECHKFLKI